MPPLSLQKRWQSIVKAVDGFLENLLTSLVDCPPSLKEALLYSTLGAGKRFRPLLVFAAADLFSLPFKSSLRIAAAIELVHAYSLIHDDLPAMDDAHWRRGKPACHLAFSEALAILVGDSLIPLAFDVLFHAETHPCSEKRLEVSRLLTKAIGCEGMVAGQVYDMEATNNPISVAQLITLQRLKTGALIEFSLLAPAILTDQSLSEKKALSLFGTHLTLAFQIGDDLLDLQNREKTGKDQEKDAQIQKKTWVTLWGEANARKALTFHHQAADSALSFWGDRAVFLKEILDFTETRQS